MHSNNVRRTSRKRSTKTPGANVGVGVTSRMQFPYGTTNQCAMPTKYPTSARTKNQKLVLGLMEKKWFKKKGAIQSLGIESKRNQNQTRLLNEALDVRIKHTYYQHEMGKR